MSLDFRSGLIITGWIYLVVALVFIIQLKTNPLKNILPYWISTFILGGLGVFIQVMELPYNGRLTPLLSHSFFIAGGYALVAGASKYLDIKLNRYFYYVLIGLMVLMNVVFSTIFPNDTVLDSAISILYIIFLVHSFTVFQKGFIKEKNISWIILLIAVSVSLIFLILRIFLLFNITLPELVQNFTGYINVWFLGFNALIILGVVITIASYHLKLLNNNILMRDTMYGVVGHDLKEPLTHIYSLSNLALKHNLPREQCREIMMNINSMALNANYLARNLLDWAYVSRQVLKPVLQKIGVNDVISSEIELYSPIAEQNRVYIKFIQNEQVDVISDENMFRIIIRNLINNAVKYSKPHSCVIINMKRKNDSLEIKIKDKGAGIDAKLLEELNNPRPDTHLSSRGMGLYITKTYVTLLNADLSFKSTENLGTTATFILSSLE